MIPVHNNLQNEIINNYHGNMGLLFNKFLKINDRDFKFDKKIEFPVFQRKYLSCVQSVSNLLTQKHVSQINTLRKFSSNNNYIPLTIIATTSSPFLTGGGLSHPSETGFLFDHNLGIPYIPSTSIKGIVRTAYTINFLKNHLTDADKPWLEQNGTILHDEKTVISFLFGGNHEDNDNTQEYSGFINFLDSYSLDLPALKVDIINNHYPDYYNSSTGHITPPKDNMNPNIIEFLTVKEGTQLVFRMLIDRNKLNKFHINEEDTISEIKNAFKYAFSELGFGAKTAVGYGRFKNIITDNQEINKLYKKRNLIIFSEEEKLQHKIDKILDNLSNSNLSKGEVDSIFDEWINDDSVNQNRKIASAFKLKVKSKKSNGELSSKYIKILDILGENNVVEKNEKTTDNISKENIKSDRDSDINKLDKYLNSVENTTGKAQKKAIRKLNKHSKEIKKFRQWYPDDEVQSIIKKLIELGLKL